MSEIFFKTDEHYKKKYFKYKFKYLELKHNNIEGGLGWDTLTKSALNFTKTNPTAAAGIFGTIASNVQQLPDLSSGLSNIALTGFIKYLSQLPEYQQLVKSGLMTPQNEKLMFELIKLEIGHLADPSFYPIMFDLIKNIIILSGSAETFNPVMVLSALSELYNILNVMKEKYPKDFILLSTFLKNNKDKIFSIVSSIGFGYPGMQLQFDMFMRLIEVNP